jgi:adenylate cyclase class 2
MRNVEFKAELRDPSIARAVARSIGAHLVATLDQTDTYYKTFNGRLKKRETLHANGGEAEPVEYIHYERDNRTRPKISAFQIMTDDEFRERYGTQPLPIWLVVRKRRAVYILDHTRIHLDEVEDLGSFIEFEVLVSKNNNVARAHETVEELRAAFGPVMGEAISVGYSDLLADQADAANSKSGS